MGEDTGAVPTLRLRPDVAADDRVLECQVFGCAQSLPSRAYHKRYRICHDHATMPKMMHNGELVRWCQQCGKFQTLDNFDDGRKTCRKKLDLHNAQRKRARARKQGLLAQEAPETGQSHDGSPDRQRQLSGLSSGLTEPSRTTGTAVTATTATVTAIRAPTGQTAALQGPELSCDAFPPAMVTDVQQKLDSETRTRRTSAATNTAIRRGTGTGEDGLRRAPSGFESAEQSLEPTTMALPSVAQGRSSLPAQCSLPLPPRGTGASPMTFHGADPLAGVDIDILLQDCNEPISGPPTATLPGSAGPAGSLLEAWAAFDPAARSPLSGVHAAALAARAGAGAAQLIFPDAGSLTPHHANQQLNQQLAHQQQQPGVVVVPVSAPKRPRTEAGPPGDLQSWHASLLPPPEPTVPRGPPERTTSAPSAPPEGPTSALARLTPSTLTAEAIHAASMQLFNMPPSELPPVIFESLVGTLQAQALLSSLPGVGAPRNPPGFGPF